MLPMANQEQKKADTLNSHTRPRLIVLREYGGSEDMKTAIERALEALIIEKYDERLYQKAS